MERIIICYLKFKLTNYIKYFKVNYYHNLKLYTDLLCATLNYSEYQTECLKQKTVNIFIDFVCIS